MATEKPHAYCTLLMNDNYLPGAMVLAHSLRDSGTQKKLAVLAAVDDLSTEAMSELKKVYDYIIPTGRIVNQTPENLTLMDRLDLHSTFTKINVWKLTQFSKIVYMDADMVALRAPDELFNLSQPFSAAPDIGWPDIFNSGLMVLKPDMGEYYSLLAMAQRGISFDGADQGLLNQHFKNTYNRLSFTYNVTPSANYQYVPAYRHFQSGISVAHFIGKDKPWTDGRHASLGSGPQSEMVARWWAVYDRHYRQQLSGPEVPAVVSRHVEREIKPIGHDPSPSQLFAAWAQEGPEMPSVTVTAAAEPVYESNDWMRPKSDFQEQKPSEPAHENKPHAVFVPPVVTWDPAREPPPADSKPEASNFEFQSYTMSSDPEPFVAPVRYPSPPKDMWYEPPKTPTYQAPAPLFPFETYEDKQAPARVWADAEPEREPEPEQESVPAPDPALETKLPTSSSSDSLSSDSSASSYNFTNVWDKDPWITKHVEKLTQLQQRQKQVIGAPSLLMTPTVTVEEEGSAVKEVFSPTSRHPSFKLTDFPTEVERPSLPVTPAPRRRSSFWGEERDSDGQLPVADGVPSQDAFDPAKSLEALARSQSQDLVNKLSNLKSARELPTRPLPYGSENVKSPTYVDPVPVASGAASPHGLAATVVATSANTSGVRF